MEKIILREAEPYQLYTEPITQKKYLFMPLGERFNEGSWYLFRIDLKTETLELFAWGSRLQFEQKSDKSIDLKLFFFNSIFKNTLETGKWSAVLGAKAAARFLLKGDIV